MAFPVIEATAVGFEESTDSSYACPLPADIQPGDMLLIFVAGWTSGADSAQSTPSGWTQLFQVNNNGRLESFACFYKIATGSEGSSVTISQNAGTFNVSTAYRITGYGGPPEAATATGTSSNPNAPSLSPSWGRHDNLWIAATGIVNSSVIPQSAPSGYSDLLQQVSNFFGNQDTPRIASAVREAEADTEDPGPFGATAGTWTAATVAIPGVPEEPTGKFPKVESTATGNLTTAVNTYACPLPSGIQDGDLLLVIVGLWHTSSARTFLTPSGWTQLFQQNNFGQLRALAAFYKVATGAEGSTVTINASGDMFAASVAYRISGYDLVPEGSATGSSATGNPDPPSLTPSWGSANALWIAVGAHIQTSTPQLAPALFSDLLQDAAVASGQDRPRVASALRKVEAGTLNPGPFGVIGADWAAATIAIKAAEGGSARQMMHYRRLRI